MPRSRDPVAKTQTRMFEIRMSKDKGTVPLFLLVLFCVIFQMSYRFKNIYGKVVVEKTVEFGI